MRCKCGCKRETKPTRKFIQGHHRRVQPRGTAWCPVCQQFKDLRAFYPNEARTDGVHPYCRACTAVKRHDHYLANSEKIRAYSREWARKYNRELRARTLAAYGGHCVCCGEQTPQFLVIDHIAGGGNQHRRSLGIVGGGGADFYRWLARENYPQGFRVLCHNCNMSRGAYGFCPHEDRALRKT